MKQRLKRGFTLIEILIIIVIIGILLTLGMGLSRNSLEKLKVKSVSEEFAGFFWYDFSSSQCFKLSKWACLFWNWINPSERKKSDWIHLSAWKFRIFNLNICWEVWNYRINRRSSDFRRTQDKISAFYACLWASWRGNSFWAAGFFCASERERRSMF